MKKIFYFLLLMLSGFVWGQISQFNNLCENNSDLSLSIAYQNIEFKTAIKDGSNNISCKIDENEKYKSINYYKVVSGGKFEFNYTASSIVNFHVWVLSESELNDFFFNNKTRYESIRSSYSNVNSEKGLFISAIDECEYYDNIRGNDADGKLKPIDVVAGQYIVIGFVSRDLNAKINFVTSGGTAIVCEPEPVIGNTELSGKCFNEIYTIPEVKENVQDRIIAEHGQTIDLDKIKIFNSVTSTDVITTDINSSGGLNQTFVAKVYNGSRVEYIYDITINFKAGYNFDFTDYTYEVCGKNYDVDYRGIIEKNVTDYTNVNNFRINYVEYDGRRYSDTETINFNSDFVRMDVSITYIGTDLCETTGDFQIAVRDVKHYNLHIPDIITTCNSKFTIDKLDLRIKTQVINDEDYDLKFYLSDGTEVFDTDEIDILSNQLNLFYQAVHYRTGCLGDKGTLIIKQTQAANITNDEIKDICLAEFSQTHVDDAIEIINPGNSYLLRFYKIDGIEIQEIDLYDYIKTTKDGKIIVKALAADNGNTICNTEKELKFKLDESDITLPTITPIFEKKCMDAASVTRFEISEIEKYLEDNVYHLDLEFRNFDLAGYSLNENSELEVTYDLREFGECWTSSKIILKTINKPNVSSATYSDKFCEGETLTIDDHLLKNSFGANVFDYEIFIDGTEYIQGSSIQKVLNFGTNTFLNIPIEFKNRLSDTCSTTVDLTVNKKDDLAVDVPSLEDYTQENPIVFCGGQEENAKNQIQAILDYINGQEPGLVAQSSVDEIFAEFNSENDFIDVVFEDPNFCGTVTVKFFYERNALPNIEVKNPDPLCAGEIYKLDFTTQTGYENYNYYVEKEDGTRVPGIYTFDLDAETYKITIEDKNSDCSVVKTLDVKNAETPTIEKITINEKSIIVSAKGNGKLEYALFDSTGNVIVDWQTNNELIIPLIIPDDIKDNDFTVKVRLNGCGVFERKEVIYLVLPNVVTPNNDGFNDAWKPMTKNGKVNDTSNSYKLIIFDRYGKHILSKEGIGIIEWDGTHNGKPVADGTYWYLLESNEELQVLYSGYIVVKRKIN